MEARNRAEERILAAMDEMAFPESVQTTVLWATRKAPDSAAAVREVEALLKQQPTGKEMTRAVQKYIR